MEYFSNIMIIIQSLYVLNRFIALMCRWCLIFDTSSERPSCDDLKPNIDDRTKESDECIIARLYCSF